MTTKDGTPYAQWPRLSHQAIARFHADADAKKPRWYRVPGLLDRAVDRVAPEHLTHPMYRTADREVSFEGSAVVGTR